MSLYQPILRGLFFPYKLYCQNIFSLRKKIDILGRAGKSGFAITIIERRDRKQAQVIKMFFYFLLYKVFSKLRNVIHS